MQNKVFHILNGDALKEQFPKQILGTQIVMRECLVDGPVDGNTITDFFDTRATFISQHYATEKSIYHNTSKSEIEKILEIPNHATIYLWFEDDLFCQVNMWFVSSLLEKYLIKNNLELFLVRPSRSYLDEVIPQNYLQYGFGGLDEKHLEKALENPVAINNGTLVLFSKLWRAYQDNDNKSMSSIFSQMDNQYSFIGEAIQAQIDRKIGKKEKGRPEEILLEIMKELNTTDFKKIFPAFKNELLFMDSEIYR